MKISEVMRPGAFTIPETANLGDAQLAMIRANIGHLPVVAGDRLVGMLSERDVLAARAQAAEAARGWWSIRVHDAMHAPPHTARPEDSLTEIAARMAAEKIGAMPVVERGKLLGIATVTDVLEAEVRVAMGPPAEAVLVAEVMTPWPITIRPAAPLSEAVSMMIRHRIRHLPVVDQESSLVGVLSEGDLRAAIGDLAQYNAGRFEMATAELHVHDVMSSPAVTVRPDVSLGEVARKFTSERLSAVPVVDGFGALLGIVSYVDVLRMMAW